MIKYKVLCVHRGRSDSVLFAKEVEDQLNAYAPHGWRLAEVSILPGSGSALLFMAQEVEDRG